MIEIIKKSFGGGMLSPNNYGALTLAYLGDGIYEMYVRSYLLRRADRKVRDLHKEATALVCAEAQAAFYHKIADILTEEEQAVFHRGRNTKSQAPKHASVMEYRIATGVETLLGYLYLKDDLSRISELMEYLFD